MLKTRLAGYLLAAGLAFVTGFALAQDPSEESAKSTKRFVQIAAKDKFERSRIADLGISIEATRSDSIWGFAELSEIEEARKAGLEVLGVHSFETGRGGHQHAFDFPEADARFHNYAEMTNALRLLVSKNADIAKMSSIGKTIEGRDIWAVHINTSPEALQAGKSSKPGVVFMGNHHAREHLSAEVPLMLAQHLLSNRGEAKISRLLESRDLWIIPMVNPDGVEWDIATGKYRMWRKNRRDNGNGTFGVDLNRNYGYQWGTGGSSTSTSSDVYMGKEPFSEPETQAIRDFIDARTNTKVLLSFHTFSELILYPWGHTHDPISDGRDLKVFEKLATTMSKWNGYTPQPASDLYIASGDTTDWAYGKHGIFAFTFELSPRHIMDGGFYPGARVIDTVFQANLKPCLYLIEIAGDPYQVIENAPSNRSFLRNYVEPSVPSSLLWETHPLRP